MGDHKNIRPFHEPLRRAGIQNPGEILIADPIQQVIIADRTDHLVRPLMAPQVGAFQFVTAAAGLRAAMEVAVIAPGGTWFYAVGASEAGGYFYFQGIVTVGGLGAPVVPTFATASLFGEGTPQNTIAVGDTATAPPSPLGFQEQFIGGTPYKTTLTPPLWVGPGRFFVVMNSLIGDSANLSVWYQEIPGRSDVPVE